METKLSSKVFPDSYRDSVLLMKMAGAIRAMEGVDNAEVIIATDANKAILEFNGLLTDEIRAATPNDLVVSVSSADPEVCAAAIERAEDLIAHGMPDDSGRNVLYTAKSVAGALAMEPEANLAILSIPGPFVKKEAMRLIEAGVNLLIFSDNVPAEDELAIKRAAVEKGVLVMGPDCGTAMIGGAALAFANKCRRGPIGMVCASGTGLQEVACLVHNHGSGISNALGTGSNDVTDAIGGISMMQGLKMLEADASTEVIVVVSKPPSPATAEALSERFASVRKPMVVVFLGRQEPLGQQGGVYYAATLEEAALKALELAGVSAAADGQDESAFIESQIARHKGKRRYLRGLFAGGTMATESAIVCKDVLDGLTANMKVPGVARMEDSHACRGNAIVDLGADEFTLGKPHPMIDPEMKNRRLLQEATDGDVAVVLLDFVLGYGVHPDPAGSTIPWIEKAREAVGRDCAPTFIASVTGTELDPQDRAAQKAALEATGVRVLASNAQAARVAAAIAAGCQ